MSVQTSSIYSIDSTDSEIIVSCKVTSINSTDDLDLSLERKLVGSTVQSAELVIHGVSQPLKDPSTSPTKPILRVPLQTPCDWENLEATLDNKTSMLRVNITLKSTSEQTPRNDPSTATLTNTPTAKDVKSGRTGHVSDDTISEGGESFQTAPSDTAVDVVDEINIIDEESIETEQQQPPTPQLGDAALVASETIEVEASDKKKKKKKKKKKAASSSTEATDQPNVVAVEQQQQETQQPEVAKTDAAPPPERKQSSYKPPTPLEGPAVAGISSIGTVVQHRPLSGPVLKDELAKEKAFKKGEDQWLLKPHNSWKLQNDNDQAVSFGAWGVFDGHGGRHVATFASNNLLKYVLAEVDKPQPLYHSQEDLLAADPNNKKRQELLQDFAAQATEEDWKQWAVEREFISRLPQALVDGFVRCNDQALKQFKNGGGSTATLAVCCGWELFLANVGDSLAFLDTGSEVLALTSTHRLDDNAPEQERCVAEGSRVKPETGGKTLRVWPGGLMMSRTIGDYDAGSVVNAVPAVSQVTIPAQGARLIIGSDGLFDAMHPKTAAHHTRDMSASEAAHKLLTLAIKTDKLGDDVTIVIVDFLPNGCSTKAPPCMTMYRASSKHHNYQGGVAHVAHPWHPLEQPHPALSTVVDTNNDSTTNNIDPLLVVGAERRRKVLQDIADAEAERLEAERLLKERLEEIEAEAVKNEQGMSDLHKELASLRLNPDDLEGAWDAVGSSNAAKADAEKKKKSKGNTKPRPGKQQQPKKKPAATSEAPAATASVEEVKTTAEGASKPAKSKRPKQQNSNRQQKPAPAAIPAVVVEGQPQGQEKSAKAAPKVLVVPKKRPNSNVQKPASDNPQAAAPLTTEPKRSGPPRRNRSNKKPAATE